MKKLTLLGLTALLCLLLTAQENTPVKPLAVGDTVPDIIFTNLINYPKKIARLSNFKNKLVLLDFWAAWCGSCVHKFSALDSLQRYYAGKLQVLAINCTRRTKDTHEKITAILHQWQQVNGKTFAPLVVADSSLLFKEVFPHRSIPHYVWINAKGRVVAITGSEEVTAENITALLKGEDHPLPVKNDFIPQSTTNR